MTKELSVIIPVYNEINLIEKFVKKLFKTFDQKTTKFIFVDDGSDDGTKEFLIENISTFINTKNFELISLSKNFGKGYAVRQGIKKIEGKYVLFIDSDLEYESEDGFEIYQIAKQNESIDVNFGSGSTYESIDVEFGSSSTIACLTISL